MGFLLVNHGLQLLICELQDVLPERWDQFDGLQKARHVAGVSDVLEANLEIDFV